ncbi:competence/damage-inducible protein A [bacterium]|nr:competence/damage-inducible protein A [bacterium]MBU1636516.1 competence/damage-inducible protein A [bacterium]MBU1880481.1 competence/damage-inducible protein A [bacterium]
MSNCAEIITIGDEVLMGQIVNTNASFIGQMMTEAGISVGWMTTIGDDRQQLLHAFRLAETRAKAIIITGGLGPTPDDITKPCLVEYLQDTLEFREDLLGRVTKRFTDRGFEMPETSRNQAEFPKSATVIDNPHGTASGIHYSRAGKEWFALPGVPLEMQHMIESYVVPRLQDIGLGGQVEVSIYRTAGIGESHLKEELSNFQQAQELVEVAFLPKYFGVDLKLTARGADQNEIRQRLTNAEALLEPDLLPHVYGRDTETLAEAVGKLAIEKGVRIATAESCTGGMIAKLFTDISGSSQYFERGAVTYSNEAKKEMLGVPEQLLNDHGAVSEEVAIAMATGLLERCPADITVSVTGIAGPTGGTEEKPVGLVYIGIADKNGSDVKQFRFISDRDLNRKRSALAAVKFLYERIKNLDL